MYYLKDLKKNRPDTGGDVTCPVEGCEEPIQRLRGRGSLDNEKYLCRKHGIYVSPTTFAYQKPEENLLWNTGEDLQLFNEIKRYKRESRRLGHECSEDAVTWNVFRYLERNNLLESYLTEISGKHQLNPEVIYWTYSKNEGRVWTPLENAWEKFEKYTPNHRTEPDLIIKTEDAVFLVEAKFNSSNYSYPDNQKVKDKYMAGGWFGTVFKKGVGFDDVAVVAKRYELMRMWLLGSCMASESSFYLLNLVRKRSREKVDFSSFVEQSKSRVFKKITWEDICSFVKNSAGDSVDKGKMLDYFVGKTIGYRNEVLQKAFDCV